MYLFSTLAMRVTLDPWGRFPLTPFVKKRSTGSSYLLASMPSALPNSVDLAELLLVLWFSRFASAATLFRNCRGFFFPRLFFAAHLLGFG